ncbi:unnamed protein product, partial [Discosporangium mesarthrocarpum]
GEGWVDPRRVLGNEGDVGARVDIWWPRYRMFYRGTITAYDPVKSQHKVHYDDEQVCHYDLSQKPHMLVLRAPAPNDPTSTAPVAPPTPGPEPAEGAASAGIAEALWAPRPPPEAAVPAVHPPGGSPPPGAVASAYVLDAITRFGKTGGGMGGTLARRLSGPHPGFREALGALRLGRSVVARATARASRECAWTLKEIVPGALLAAPPETMRDATNAEVAECVSTIQQLAMCIGAGAGAGAGVG